MKLGAHRISPAKSLLLQQSDENREVVTTLFVESIAQNPNFNQASGKGYVAFEGTVLETVLATRLNGDSSGPVHASGHASETRRASQNRQADFGRCSRNKASHADNFDSLLDPSGPLIQNIGFV